MRATRVLLLMCAQTASVGVAAQAPQQIPIRTLAPVAKVSGTFGGVLGVRQLPGGRVLINDVVRRRLAVFDSTLTSFTVLADTAGAGVKYTGVRGLALIPYLGDTTLFVDYDSRSLVVIGPDGKLGRTISAPIPRDALNMNGGRADAQGRLVYRVLLPVATIPMPDGSRAKARGADSAVIVRADFNTRKVDTIGRVRMYPPAGMVSSVDASGKRTFRRTENPVPPPIDEWTVLSDGTVAMVRGWDYHIDWIDTDGTRRSTPKMPFDWRRLTDQDKLAKIDSAKKILDSVTAIGKNTNKVFTVRYGEGVLPTRGEESIVAIDYVPLDSMGNYVAPLRSGAVKADADGKLWIVPTTSSQAKGGLLYDVVNKKGELFERVQLPGNRDIIGFGPNGVVFLIWRDDANAYRIERTKVVRPSASIRPRPAP